MGIMLDGIKAERMARNWLLSKGIKNLQQIDWLYKDHNGKYWCVESKARELFEPPPFWGTGLDISQLELRKQLLSDLGIDTILLIFEKNGNRIWWQRLSILEKTEHFDTRNKIRIYNINNFNREEMKI